MQPETLLRWRVLVLLPVLLLAACATGQRTHNDARSADQIRTLREKGYAAYFAADTAGLREIEDPDFGVVGPKGELQPVTGRYEAIDAARKKGDWFPGGATWSDEGSIFKDFGNAVLVYGITRSETGGQTRRFATTELWANRAGRWRLVHLHFHELNTRSQEASR